MFAMKVMLISDDEKMYDEKIVDNLRQIATVCTQ